MPDELQISGDATEAKKQPESELDEETKERIKFTYTRSNFYREVIATGLYGGMTPDLDIHLSLFNQHPKDFTEQTFYLTKRGALGSEIKPESEQDESRTINREVEVGVTISIATAIQITRWLRDKILEAQKIMDIEVPEDVGEKISK